MSVMDTLAKGITTQGSVTGFILPFHFAKLTNQHWFSMVCII